MARFSLAPRKATPNSLNIWTSPLPHLSPFSGSPPCPLLRIPCRSQTTPLRCRCGAVAVRLLLSFNRTRPSKSIHDFSSTQISARHPRDAPLSLKSLLSAIRPQFIRGKPDKTLVGAVSYSNSVHRMLRICHLHIGVFSKSSPPPCVPFVPHFSSLAPQNLLWAPWNHSLGHPRRLTSSFFSGLLLPLANNCSHCLTTLLPTAHPLQQS